jgi:hypothetical protein
LSKKKKKKKKKKKVQEVWEEYAGSVRRTNVAVGRDREPAYRNGENESGGEL